MGAQLAALIRIQAALEQGAENGGFDGRPVEPGQFPQGLDIGPVQRQRLAAVEQAAVEPVDRFEADASAGGHGPEQFAQHRFQFGRVILAGVEQPGEQALRQQADVLGEQAEQQPDADMADAPGIVATSAQGQGQVAEAAGGGFGERRRGLPGPQPLRVGEGPLEHLARLGVAQVVQRDDAHRRHGAGEGGVDDDAVDIADDQQRRVFQRRRVQLQLLEGGLQVLPLALVLPAEAGAPPDIGPAVAAAGLGRPVLEGEPLAGRVGLGRRGLVEQPAQVDEMLLRRRALLERGVPPFANEGVGHHEFTRAGRWGGGLGFSRQ